MDQRDTINVSEQKRESIKKEKLSNSKPELRERKVSEVTTTTLWWGWEGGQGSDQLQGGVEPVEEDEVKKPEMEIFLHLRNWEMHKEIFHQALLEAGGPMIYFPQS